jgi:SAM-dependent methyltransferase
MKLNLGCGVYPFPYAREAVPNPEHNLPLPDEVFEPGWCNVDKHAAPGVQEQINLFRFPWIRSSNGSPFNDSSVDYIWAAHLAEHIPHEVKAARGLPGVLAKQYEAMVLDLDGFFVFFAECWRVLKPGGLMHVRFPYATSYPSLNDPTHTRYLTPGSFGYLKAREGSAPFDYDVPCNFELEGVYEYRLRGQWATEVGNYSQAGRERLLRENYAVCDEVRLTLRAVKE